MIKRILGLAFLVLTTLLGFAQMPQMQPLPLNPNVKAGVLPNGLHYYILHNAEPKNRANFYIAQKVGSTLETKEQLGLAHFLEHMAFNGTAHYPGKNLLNYLQSKGIRFGADINAYTAFDETVYNINNVPTTDKALMDSVLLALHDWSCEIALENDEIESERGVIEEEWRSRNDANSRMLLSVLPKIYQEYQYQQTPIGKMEVVKNFKPEVLRAYYEKWYRPDQQGIVIVGDFDADEMEKKVKEMFSPIEMPANAAEREYPVVSDNQQPVYAYFEDAEFQIPIVRLSFKSDKLPFEMRNTVPGLMANLAQNIIVSLINQRLSEYKQNPACTYAEAVVNQGDFWVSKTKDAFTITVVPKGDLNSAFNEAMRIIARACKTGFSEAELERVRANYLSSIEKAYNERNNTQTESLASGLIRHFIDNSPEPGIEAEYEMMKQILPMIPVDALNQMVAKILTPENQVLVVAQPKKEGVVPADEQKLFAIVNDAMGAQYEALVEEKITQPLISKLPKPGKIKSEKAGEFGTTEFTLSNGVTVVVKPTDFKADEISLTAVRRGGKRSIDPSQAVNALFMEDAFAISKLGNFDKNTLRKYLAGKHVGVGFTLGNNVYEIEGVSTVKDLPTMMEMIYATFTSVSADEAFFQSTMDQARTMLANMDKNPNNVFKRRLADVKYGHNPMFQEFTAEMLDQVDYPQILKMIKEATANAADYTFIFVGNVDVNTLKPLLEKYIATLPSAKKGKKTPVVDKSSVLLATGEVKDHFKQPMNEPSTIVANYFSGTDIPYSTENDINFSVLGQILGIRFTETLREEMGGTYSPSAGASMNPFTGEWTIAYNYVTNAEILNKMNERAELELNKLISNGASEGDFQKVKEAIIKQLEIGERDNETLKQNLLSYKLGVSNDFNKLAVAQKLNLADFNKWMKSLKLGKNRIEVIMEGVKAE